jgi:hypothetical protein
MKASKEQVIEAGHDEENAAHVVALCEFLDCEPGDIERAKWEHYGLALYSLGSKEYAIGTDEEADKACAEYIEQTAWAFRASFVLSECDLPRELEEAIESFQSSKCEGANEAILALIEKTCGLASFVESAIRADGRGHFLSGYDGNENDAGEFCIYRVN